MNEELFPIQPSCNPAAKLSAARQRYAEALDAYEHADTDELGWLTRDLMHARSTLAALEREAFARVRGKECE